MEMELEILSSRVSTLEKLVIKLNNRLSLLEGKSGNVSSLRRSGSGQAAGPQQNKSTARKSTSRQLAQDDHIDDDNLDAEVVIKTEEMEDEDLDNFEIQPQGSDNSDEDDDIRQIGENPLETLNKLSEGSHAKRRRGTKRPNLDVDSQKPDVIQVIGNQISWNGFMYTLDRMSKLKRSWACSKRRQKTCRARLHTTTTLDKDIRVLDVIGVHSHEPDHAKCAAKLARFLKWEKQKEEVTGTRSTVEPLPSEELAVSEPRL